MDIYSATKNRLKLFTFTPRIRHLTSLVIKNMSYRSTDLSYMVVYFTLHRDISPVAFYKSELLKGTVNLSWSSFDLTYLPSYYTSTNQVCIRIWVKDADATPKVHLEYEVDLKLLQLVEPSETSRRSERQTDSEDAERTLQDVVTFTMFDSLFEIPPTNICVSKEYLYLSTNQQFKLSYSFNLLARLQTLLRALKQTEHSVEKVREDIQRGLTEIQHVTQKKEQVELHKLRLESIKHRLDQRKQILMQKKSRLYSKRAETSKKEKEIDGYQKAMQEDDCRFGDIKSDYYNSREKLLKENALLTKRHKQMVYELSVIYPIEQIPDGRYTIAGVCLPDPDHITSQNELACSTALGHCCHLVNMLSRFLEAPLEYPLEYRGSRSLVYDMVRPSNQMPSQKDRSYPLYSRGKDKKLFQHAVFLLNRNIENLRYKQDLHTKDCKLTLRNLKDLLQTKFDVGSVFRSHQESRSPPVPSAVQRTASVPALFPHKSLSGRQQRMQDWAGINSPRNAGSADVSSDEELVEAVINSSPIVQAHAGSTPHTNGTFHLNGSTEETLDGDLRSDVSVLSSAQTETSDQDIATDNIKIPIIGHHPGDKIDDVHNSSLFPNDTTEQGSITSEDR